jgi:hypothetical protein
MFFIGKVAGSAEGIRLGKSFSEIDGKSAAPTVKI